MTLKELEIGKSAVIKTVGGEGALRRKVVLVGKFSETFAYVNLQR